MQASLFITNAVCFSIFGIHFSSPASSEEILRGIYAYGFENPSAIQAKAIVPMSTDTDLIAQAQSGTGKHSMSLPFIFMQLIDHLFLRQDRCLHRRNAAAYPRVESRLSGAYPSPHA